MIVSFSPSLNANSHCLLQMHKYTYTALFLQQHDIRDARHSLVTAQQVCCPAPVVMQHQEQRVQNSMHQLLAQTGNQDCEPRIVPILCATVLCAIGCCLVAYLDNQENYKSCAVIEQSLQIDNALHLLRHASLQRARGIM